MLTDSVLRHELRSQCAKTRRACFARRRPNFVQSWGSSRDLTQRLDVNQYEGFMKQLGGGMNKLLDSVSDAFRQVKDVVEQISQAGQQLRATSQMMSSSSVQLNRAAEE